MIQKIGPKENPNIPRANQQTSLSKSVSRTANILSCLSRGVGSVTEIAQTCQVNKSTMHRLLGELCQAGLAIQDPDNKLYFLGSLISEIASKPVITHQSLTICAAKEMRELGSYTGETVGLTGLIGLKQVSLHEIPSIHEFRIVAQKIFAEHMHAGATSRILLSQLDKKELDLVVANMDFKPLTQHTVASVEEWADQMKKVKEQGYAISCSERILGAMCMSVPIRNYVFPVALELVGPEARIKPKVKEFLYELKGAADHIQQNLNRVSRVT